jgi:lipoprotein NlpD
MLQRKDAAPPRAADPAPVPPAVKPDAKPEAKPEPRPEPKPDAKADAKPDGGADVKAGDNDSGIDWMWPGGGKVLAAFSEPSSKGLDIAGKSGDPVLAAAPGKVMYVGSGIRGYGNLVIIKHSNGYLSAYGHNRKILVKEGQSIAKGQKVAELGDSDADQAKLHFEIRRQGKPVDPLKYLPPR